MADIAVDVVSKTDFVAAQKEIGQLRERLEAAQEEKVKEQVSALEKSLATRDEEIKNLKTEIENAKASKKDAEKSLETAKAEVESFKTKLVEAEKKIDEHVKTVVKANRVSALVDKGVDKAEAEKVVDAAAAATDELFAVIVETHAKLVEAKKATSAEYDAEKAKKEKEKKAKEKEAAKADEHKLDESEVEEEVPLSTDASAESEVDGTIAGLANFLTQEIEHSKKNK